MKAFRIAVLSLILASFFSTYVKAQEGGLLHGVPGLYGGQQNTAATDGDPSTSVILRCRTCGPQSISWGLPEEQRIVKYYVQVSRSVVVEFRDSNNTVIYSATVGTGTYSVDVPGVKGIVVYQRSNFNANLYEFDVWPYRDMEPPSTPKGLTAAPGDGRINLYWSANQEPDLHGYYVYLDGQRVTTKPINAITYVISGLENGRKYKVSLSAVDTSGNESERTAEIEVIPTKVVYIPPPAAPTGLQGIGDYKKASLSWTENTDHAIGYFVYKNGQRVNFAPITENHITVENLPGGTYNFYVTAVNQNGVESARSAIIQVTVYDYVPNVRGKNDLGKVVVYWDPVPGATEYRIYKNGNFIATTDGTSYTDTDVLKGEEYTYEVSAVVGGKEYERSKPVSLRPGDYISIPDPGSIGGGGGSRIFDSILDVIRTGFSFVSKYSTWIMIVLAVIFSPAAAAFIIWFFRKVRQPKTTKEREQREREEREGRERRERDMRPVSYMTRTPRAQRRARRGRS